MVTSNDPSAELVTYSLGSCLGVAIYDPEKRVGGLLHIMLPSSAIDPAKGESCPFMFVDTGVPRLFHGVFNLGADRRRLVIKIAGGAQLLDPNGIFNIGARNYQSLKTILAKNGYSNQGEDVGGIASRTMRLDMTTGKTSIKSPGVDLYYL